MSLRSRLENTPETVQAFELAAAEKYSEGQRLVIGGSAGAGIYLLGYAAEMTLKNAYFRFTGANPMAEVEPRLAPARSAGRGSNSNGIFVPGLIPAIKDESYHSLRFWAMLLQATRASQSQSWADNEFTLEFERCTERLYNYWWVEMRYRCNLATSNEALQVLGDAGWLLTHSVDLWS